MKIHFWNVKNNLTWFNFGQVIVIVLMVYPLTYLITGNWFFAGCVSGVLSGLLTLIRDRYIQSLQRRILKIDNIDWDVTLNGVKIGTMKDSHYAQIKLQVHNDHRNYIAQAFNMGKVVLKSIDCLYLNIPIAVFWLLIGVALISPETFSSIYIEAQKAKPDAIVSVLKAGAQAFGLFSIVIVFLAATIGARFGYVNCFDKATTTALRTHFHQAAEGDILMFRCVDGSLVFNDEMNHVRHSGN